MSRPTPKLSPPMPKEKQARQMLQSACAMLIVFGTPDEIIAATEFLWRFAGESRRRVIAEGR